MTQGKAVYPNAWIEIHNFLEPNEVIKSIVFGRNEWHEESSMPSGNFRGYIPEELREVPLDLETAKPFLQDWQIDGGYGGEEIIPICVWTNERVLFIGSYDGATWLTGVPRNPQPYEPFTIGGG